MGGITRSCLSANWQRGRGSRAPGVSVDVVQPRLVGVPPGKSVGAYDDLPDSSHGHALRGGRGDKCKRCPSAALCVSCLCCGEYSQCPSYNSQKPFSSCAEAVEHIPFLLRSYWFVKKLALRPAHERQSEGMRTRIRKPGHWLAFLRYGLVCFRVAGEGSSAAKRARSPLNLSKIRLLQAR